MLPCELLRHEQQTSKARGQGRRSWPQPEHWTRRQKTDVLLSVESNTTKIGGRMCFLTLLEMGADAGKTKIRMKYARWRGTHFSGYTTLVVWGSTWSSGKGIFTFRLHLARESVTQSCPCKNTGTRRSIPTRPTDWPWALLIVIENAKRTGNCRRFSWNERFDSSSIGVSVMGE